MEECNFFIKDALLLQLSMQGSCCKILQNKIWNDGINLDSVSLIYRYSDAMCQSCLDSELNLLANLEDSIGKGKVLILPLVKDYRDSKIRVKSKLKDFNYLLIKDSLLDIPENEFEIPCRYFAFIDGEGNIEEIYFPNENIEVTMFYLKHYLNKNR